MVLKNFNICSVSKEWSNLSVDDYAGTVYGVPTHEWVYLRQDRDDWGIHQFEPLPAELPGHHRCFGFRDASTRLPQVGWCQTHNTIGKKLPERGSTAPRDGGQQGLTVPA